ncbi:MAG: hypothetical protein JNJ57_00905 [Saprospiraceae bacterium]|nr:hypothetical protein [Saprospiraceae bacterium]
MKTSIGFLSIIFLLQIACKNSKTEYSHTPVSGDEAPVAWQSCVYFTDHQLSVCFIGAEEYRCPCYTDCIWEGAVNATIQISTQNGLDTTIVLTTNSNPAGLHQSETIEGKTIRFLRTDGLDQGCADYGNYNKYKAVVLIE